MLRFKPSRLFFILAPCVLLIGLIIPVVAFAKTPSSHASAVSNWSKTYTVAVTQDCLRVVNPPAGAGRQVIGTFNANQEVEGTVVMKSGDATEIYQEAIALIETNGSFTKLILANGVTHNFEFTTHSKGDKLTACFANVGGDDESDTTPPNSDDHSGTVTFKYESVAP